MEKLSVSLPHSLFLKRRNDLETEKYWEIHCRKAGIKEKAPNV
jgi:hypothetical protein